MDHIIQNVVSEWSFYSKKKYKDAFNDVELNILFTAQDGQQKLVPAFWAGRNIWRVRFSSPQTGTFNYKTICSDKDNHDLNGREGKFVITPYRGDNLL